ncbi:MAG: hypothetical protein ACP5EP_12855 [Acidobacteriaceae bacterium]
MSTSKLTKIALSAAGGGQHRGARPNNRPMRPPLPDLEVTTLEEGTRQALKWRDEVAHC